MILILIITTSEKDFNIYCKSKFFIIYYFLSFEQNGDNEEDKSCAAMAIAAHKMYYLSHTLESN